jgi:antitoxin (DNA-binding transcriptional repressor) of toxin-antitoxin stability system
MCRLDLPPFRDGRDKRDSQLLGDAGRAAGHQQSAEPHVRSVTYSNTRLVGTSEEPVMPETRVPVDEMQSHFDEWIRRVEEGEQLVLTRSGQEIARVHAARDPTASAALPSLKEWRVSITVEGEGMSETVQRQRWER